ncbi:MAG TPA: hypothetical protein VIO32_11250 [Candidatus Baltobacteraceae bacterium]
MTRWIFVTLLAVLASWPAHALAQQVISTSSTPVIRVQMRSGRLTVHTWDKPQVQIDSNVAVRARHVGPAAVAAALPPEITIFSMSVQSPSGSLTLPPEGFAFDPSLLVQPHDGVVVFGGDQDANVTITVPNTTALLLALVFRGGIAVNGYHGGTFVTQVHTGGIDLENVTGDGYAEVARGPLFVRNSAFNRIRARTATGNIIFRNCNVRQIEASSIDGNIAYDNGTFVPGIARFESQNGNIAIGVAGGGASIAAHSTGGKIFAGFSRGAAVIGSPTDAQAIVGPGGPIVTANSQRGAVYLYNGSIGSHGRLQGAWQSIGRMLQRRRPLQQKFPHRGHI